ncbi:MAG: hypothetical protein GY799_32815 [Desulfobulbaceae bacterium]|nr:hypothetical protein [Desulfobulbaceae bacterium]
MNSILGNDSTFSDKLDKVARKELGSKFHGVYPSDMIPKLTSVKPYSIINTDNSKKPGSHWVGVAFDPRDSSYLVYDSYGRKTSKLIPDLKRQHGGRIVESKNDAEQRLKENNCGQRCIAWLKCVDRFGYDLAKLV